MYTSYLFLTSGHILLSQLFHCKLSSTHPLSNASLQSLQRPRDSVKRDVYSDAVSNGEALWNNLQIDPGNNPVRTTWAQLFSPTEENPPGLGWDTYDEVGPFPPPAELIPAFHSLGIPIDEVDEEYESRTAYGPDVTIHDPSTGEDREVTPSYNNLYGPYPGVLIGVRNYRYRSPVHWSLATALLWQDTCHTWGVASTNLRHVFRYKVADPTSDAIIRTVVERYGLGTFVPRQEPFFALMYKPNVRGVAWMLLQHVPIFGRKTIRSISVFEAPVEGEQQLMLYISIVQRPRR